VKKPGGFAENGKKTKKQKENGTKSYCTSRKHSQPSPIAD
jgi:hypothetical protein